MPPPLHIIPYKLSGHRTSFLCFDCFITILAIYVYQYSWRGYNVVQKKWTEGLPLWCLTFTISFPLSAVLFVTCSFLEELVKLWESNRIREKGPKIIQRQKRIERSFYGPSEIITLSLTKLVNILLAPFAQRKVFPIHKIHLQPSQESMNKSEKWQRIGNKLRREARWRVNTKYVSRINLKLHHSRTATVN